MNSLPRETIEQIFITTASFSTPFSIAALAQTCKSIHNLVYHPQDQHLWREIFLTTFDDPRPALSILVNNEPEFDWMNEFVVRIRAARDFAAGKVQTCSLQTLRSVIKTSSPLPPIKYQNMIDGHPAARYPTFPPLLLITASGNPSLSPSRNVAWLDNVMQGGYPSDLVSILFNEEMVWPDREQAHVFSQLLCCTGFSPSKLISTPPEDQFICARRFARTTVYDLRYLSSSRGWGPFLPLPGAGRLPEPIPDEDDGDLLPLLVQLEEANSSNLNPNPDLLKPDYPFLASVRLVIEANLRPMLCPPMDNVEEALHALEGLRTGGAPGFKRNLEDATDWHWDWAGVEGAWKRCVCWLDYRDLLVNNLQVRPRRFTDDSLYEVIRIVPMNLHIVGYASSQPSRPPTILIEGESTEPDHRMLFGSVSLLADGSIRWRITSTRTDSPEPEWATEGVQVGCVGSAIGVLGLWTGAGHERTDPIGPIWAWKVG